MEGLGWWHELPLCCQCPIQTWQQVSSVHLHYAKAVGSDCAWKWPNGNHPSCLCPGPADTGALWPGLLQCLLALAMGLQEREAMQVMQPSSASCSSSSQCPAGSVTECAAQPEFSPSVSVGPEQSKLFCH